MMEDYINDNKENHEEKKHNEVLPEPDKTETKKIIYASLIIIGTFLLLFFVGYYSNKNPDVETLDEVIQKTIEGDVSEDNFMYNGYVFVKVGNLWYTQIQIEDRLYDIPLHYNPKQLENVTIEGEFDDKKFNSADNLYITFDPVGQKLDYVALSAATLSLNLARAINFIPEAACTVNKTEPCKTRPIISCNNTNESVVYIKDKEPTKIILDENCIIVQGELSDLMRSTDRLIYQWYGIMS